MKKIVLMISAFLFVQPALADPKEIETVSVTPCSGSPDGILKLKSGSEFKCRDGKIDNGSICVGPVEVCGRGPTTGGQTGGTSIASGSHSGTGAATGGTSTGSSGTGSMGSGAGSTETGSTGTPQPTTPTLPVAPALPLPTVPKGLSPEQIHEFGQQVEEVRKVYQSILAGLESDAKQAEINYANQVIWCERVYAGYSPHSKRNRDECNKDALRNFEDTIKKIKENMQGAVTAYNQAIQNIKEAIAKEAGVTADELPAAPDLSKSIPSLCKLGDTWVLCTPSASPAAPPVDSGNTGTDSGSSGQTGGTVNNDNSSTTNNNSSTTNNNSSTTNNNTTVEGKDYSGVLGGIQKTLDSIAEKIGNIGNGGNGGKEKSTDAGQGDKGQPDGKPDGEEEPKEGNQISEFCKENPQAVQCAKLGTADEIRQAINEGKGEGRGFGIGEHEGVLPGFNKTNDFVENGSCPPSKIVNVLGTPQEFSYQPMCDAAIKIRPFVIFIGIFIAALIARSALMSR